jgi:hypothetical protein
MPNVILLSVITLIIIVLNVIMPKFIMLSDKLIVIVLGVVMPSVIVLCDIIPNVIVQSVIMTNVFLLSVIMLKAVSMNIIRPNVIKLSVIGLTVTAPCLYSCFLQFLHKSVSVQSNLRLVRLASLKMEMDHFPGGFQFLAHLVKLFHSYFTICRCDFAPGKHLLHSLIVLSETRKLCFETRKLGS